MPPILPTRPLRHRDTNGALQGPSGSSLPKTKMPESPRTRARLKCTARMPGPVASPLPRGGEGLEVLAGVGPPEREGKWESVAAERVRG